MNDETYTVTTESLPLFAAQILEMVRRRKSNAATVIALHGDLGAGKTTFVQSLGTLLGVSHTITSPTFTIMKGYETTDSDFTQLIHMDAYRIDDTAELGPLRFAELLKSPDTLFCIEWAEKIADALPADRVTITLTIIDETTRTAHLNTE